jgi:hypothetical protein
MASKSAMVLATLFLCRARPPVVVYIAQWFNGVASHKNSTNLMAYCSRVTKCKNFKIMQLFRSILLSHTHKKFTNKIFFTCEVILRWTWAILHAKLANSNNRPECARSLLRIFYIHLRILICTLLRIPHTPLRIPTLLKFSIKTFYCFQFYYL